LPTGEIGLEQNSLKEIKKLKARYFRLMDMKQWEELAEVFTEDATLQVIQGETKIFWQGREQIVTRNSKALKTATTVHHGHMPEIEMASEITATGIWAMFDYVIFPSGTLTGYGHYHKEYIKEDGQWRIKRIRLTRLHVNLLKHQKDVLV
jgi:uncharacterized protein (TIGR02246 family)